MANEEHLEILKQGVEVWNRWREGNPIIQPDLGKANLSKVDLGEANLSEANLFGASFRKTDLKKANLRRANLSWANLRWVNLRGADLTEGKVGYTVFLDVDLSEVKGLDTVRHLAPSTIDIDTLRNSKGNIPQIFLRGCGLSNWEIIATKLYQLDLTSAEFTDITYKIHELRIIGIRYYSCFISYSHKDESFAQRLHADLQDEGVRCWFAPEDMKIGGKIRSAIDQSIRLHDKLLLILSKNSLNSFWVESEAEKAFEEERNRNQTVLFPVRLDEEMMETDQAWAAEIRRTRHIGDFSRWKDHDAYQQAFERLLRDLKAEKQ